MSLQSTLATAQRMSEGHMRDTGKAQRPVGRAYDASPSVQADVDTFTDLFTDKCKLLAPQAQPLAEEVGGRTATTLRSVLCLPAASAPLQVGDVWELTAVAPESLARVGWRLKVTGAALGSLGADRRYEVEVVAS